MSVYLIFLKLARFMELIKFLKYLSYYSKNLPQGNVGLGTNHTVCSAFSNEHLGLILSIHPLQSQRSYPEDSDPVLYTALSRTQNPLPPVLAKPGSFLSFKSQLNCPFIKKSLSDLSTEVRFLLIIVSPTFFISCVMLS